MKVKLIQATQNPIDVMWVAARTCYSEKSPIDLWNDRYGAIEDGYEHTEEYNRQCTEKHWDLVKKILESGHESIAEYVNFVFAIEGIDRATSHQLVRHRIAVFSQQSQRYVEIKESFETISELFENPKTDEDEKYLLTVANKYFVGVTTDNYRMYIQCLISYLQGVKQGMKPEEARTFLPNATKTNIMMGVNLRELRHICSLRLCNRAQLPIRQLFQEIKKEVEAQDSRLASLLAPSCEVLGVCTEAKSCKRKPALKDVFEIYNNSKIENAKLTCTVP